MKNPFSLSSVSNPFLRKTIQAVSRVDALEDIYDRWLRRPNQEEHSTDAFIDHVLGCLGVRSEVIHQEKLSEVPASGPVVIVANHPLGGIEGMMLTQLMQRVRPDLKVLTNKMLTTIPEFEGVFVGVDVLNPGQQRENARGIREISKHLAKGGAFLVFPAGTVSGIKIPSFRLSDAPWSPMITKLIRKYSAPVLPIFVGGRNPLSFYLSAYIHKRLRTALLPRAMLTQNGRVIPLRIGDLVSPQELSRIGDDQKATHYLRVCCKVLSTDTRASASKEEQSQNEQAIRDCEVTEAIVDHITSLEDCRIYTHQNFDLYCTEFDRLGPVAELLSVERERTFRKVDEGTGRELDRDQFDPHYTHLFIWDRAAHRIVGGYRMAKTDEVREKLGLRGLYSHSLFDYNSQFLAHLGKAIEVGRSYVTPAYQKNPAALDLLWKGIGRYVAQNPEYHSLFGCVSISRQYSAVVSSMLTETFLSHYSVDDSLRKSVRARKPIKTVHIPWSTEQMESLSEIPILNKLVGRIDPGKSIPILIRHYLALNGRFISFTVNTGFNRSLDGLILVDLRQTPAKYLKRYMGEDGLREFEAQWNASPVAKTES